MDGFSTFGETRARLLRLVRREALSVSELAGELEITDNAVRTHVAALERDGLVRVAGRQRETGGKPARLYELTSSAEELLPKAYALVLEELLALFREETGAEGVESVLRRIGVRVAARAEVAEGDGAGARVRAAVALLNTIGGAVAVAETEAGWLLKSAGCPLAAVVAASPEVCALTESLVAEVTACRVRERCRREGRPRCAFEVERA